MQKYGAIVAYISDTLVTRWLFFPSDLSKIQFLPGLRSGPHWWQP